MPDTTFTFRLDGDLKAAFAEAARAEDRTQAQLLRVLMRDAVRRRRAEAAQRAAPGAAGAGPEGAGVPPEAAIPPDREQIVRLLRARESEIRDKGVTRLSLVGSVARGDAGAESDVDLLVEIEPGRKFSLIDHSGLRLYFRDLLGRDADVLVRGGLNPKLRQRIGGDETAVF